jgi:hypothetical protein
MRLHKVCLDMMSSSEASLLAKGTTVTLSPAFAVNCCAHLSSSPSQKSTVSLLRKFASTITHGHIVHTSPITAHHQRVPVPDQEPSSGDQLELPAHSSCRTVRI